jgi:hypothetical protein
MTLDQCIQMACLGIATGMLKGDIKGHRWVSAGEMLLEHPEILREIREWYYAGTLEDLRRPEMQQELRKRGRTAEQVAETAARTFVHRVLSPVTIPDVLGHFRDALRDREVVAAPYPFSFGSPLDPQKAEEAARGAAEILERGKHIRLPWED